MNRMRISSKLWPFGIREEIVTILDIGAHKIACAILIMNVKNTHASYGGAQPKIVGSAIVRASGIANGKISNLVAAETCIRRAVAKAESEAGVTAEDVVVTGSFAGLSAEIFEARIDSNRAISGRDFDIVASAAAEHCGSMQRKLLHVFVNPPEGEGHAGDPAKQRLPSGMEITAISMPLRLSRQISACLKRSLLNSKGFVAGPIASALSTTAPEERRRGVLAVDFGAQSTGCGLFLGGVPVFVEVLPWGGQAITEEIGQTFALRKFEAERLKIKQSSVFDGLQADIDLPFAHGQTGEPISKFALNHLVRSKQSYLLKSLYERLSNAGYSLKNLDVVLTGGGSLLPGMQDLACYIFGTDVRLAAPASFGGMNGGGTMSALLGASIYVCRHQPRQEMDRSPEPASLGSGYASRISQWLRASF